MTSGAHGHPASSVGRVRLPRIKKKVSRALCSPVIGSLLGRLLSDEIPSGGVRVITVDPNVMPATKASLFWGFYESAEVRFVKAHLHPDLDVIEAGSSIGVVSSHIARVLRPGRKLICVEADHRLLSALKTNLGRNASHLATRVVHGALLSAGDQNPAFLLHGERTTDGQVVRTGTGTRIPAIHLRDLRKEHAIDSYTLVCDIEGAEGSLIDGTTTELTGCRALIVELHACPAGTPDYLCGELVSRHSFRLVARYGNVCVFQRPDAEAR